MLAFSNKLHIFHPKLFFFKFCFWHLFAMQITFYVHAVQPVSASFLVSGVCTYGRGFDFKWGLVGVGHSR